PPLTAQVATKRCLLRPRRACRRLGHGLLSKTAALGTGFRLTPSRLARRRATYSDAQVTAQCMSCSLIMPGSHHFARLFRATISHLPAVLTSGEKWTQADMFRTFSERAVHCTPSFPPVSRAAPAHREAPDRGRDEAAVLQPFSSRSPAVLQPGAVAPRLVGARVISGAPWNRGSAGCSPICTRRKNVW